MKAKAAVTLFLSGALCLAGTAGAAAAEPAVTQLDKVVVTADRGASPKKEVTTNITIINSEDIQSSSAVDLGELLSQRGVQVRKYPGTLATVGLRGYRSDSHGNDLAGNVLILLNGRRVASGNAALLSLANVERVEIIRGPASLQYGAAAMGGVINVITRQGTGQAEDDFTGSVELGAGSYNLFKARADAAGNYKNFDFSFGYHFDKSDDYSDGDGDRYRYTRNDGNNSFNVDAGYTFLDVHRIGVNVNYFDASDSYSPNGKSYQDAPRSGYNWNKMDKSNVSGDVNYTGGTRDEMFTWFLRYGLGKDKRESSPYSYLTSLPAGSKSEYTVDSRFGQGQISFNQRYVTLTAGADYLDYDMDDAGTKSGYRNWAGFGLAKLRLLDDRLILSAGGRYDDFDVEDKEGGRDKSEDQFSPSVGVAVLPFEWLKVRANYAKGFRMPTPANFFGGGIWYEPALDLKPEKNDTYEAGFDIGWNYLDFSFTYFQSEGKDAIISEYQPGSGKYKARNIDKSKRRGYEIEFSGDIAKAFDYMDFELRPYVNVNYLTTRKGREDSGDPWTTLPYVPKMNVGYGLRFARADWGFSTNLNFSYFGEEVVSDYSNGGTGADKKHGRFTVVDWTARKRIFETQSYGGLDISVEINNLFNKEYTYVADYPMPGRNFYVGFIYTY